MDSPARRVAVLADSTCDIPAALAVERGITIIPLRVDIGGVTYTDGDLTQAEFFELMNAAPSLPTTSLPSPGSVAEYYRRALESADDVVSMHVSETLSGTIGVARTAAAEFGGRVHVFDSHNLSMGFGMQVLEAAKAAAGGSSVEDVLQAAERARDGVRMIVALDKLDNLLKGGRIGAVSAFVGGLLNLKVTFTIDAEGHFVPVARIRGTDPALRHTLDWCRERMGERVSGSFCVMHAMSPERAARLERELRSAYDVTEMHIVEVGSAIATHTGTGWGVALIPE